MLSVTHQTPTAQLLLSTLNYVTLLSVLAPCMYVCTLYIHTHRPNPVRCPAPGWMPTTRPPRVRATPCPTRPPSRALCLRTAALPHPVVVQQLAWMAQTQVSLGGREVGSSRCGRQSSVDTHKTAAYSVSPCKCSCGSAISCHALLPDMLPSFIVCRMLCCAVRLL